jgi:hypothetical protein
MEQSRRTIHAAMRFGSNFCRVGMKSVEAFKPYCNVRPLMSSVIRNIHSHESIPSIRNFSHTFAPIAGSFRWQAADQDKRGKASV